MSLNSRLAIRLVLMAPMAVAVIFAPAGSLRFWQGWCFVAMFVVFSAVFAGYFYRHDRGLLERRLESKEPRREQRMFKALWVPLWFCTLMLPGFDYRFGWSESLLGGVPAWVTIFSLGMVSLGWALVFEVMRVNTFASAIVKVEAGQKLITNGPYGVVRHPMYTGFILLILSTPLGLGSYVALAPAVLLVPVLIFRLSDEERVLRRELPGYVEYCERTRFRLIPSVF